MRAALRDRGVSLIELLIATAIGSLLLAGMGSVVRQAVLSRNVARDNNEAMYQARFALQRVAQAARATAPHSLLPPAANTSGDWFSPVYFCVNATAALVETISTDTGCTGTQVIAQRLSSFSATQPGGAGALDASSALISVTLTGPAGGGATVLSERMRLGGGVK